MVWDEALIIIFFFYGLAFYSMGLSLFVESGRATELQFARPIRFLAGFGVLHGTHEWIDMLERGLAVYHDTSLPSVIIWLRIAILSASFLSLLAFGESIFRLIYPNWRWKLVTIASVWFTLSAIAAPIMYDLNDHRWAIACDVLSRYTIGIPSAAVACVALWRQRSSFRTQGLERFVLDTTVAAIALGLYGIVGQIFVAESIIPPSDVINADLFHDVFGIPVQLLRAILAGIVAIALIRMLRALEVENQQRIVRMEDQQRRSEIQKNIELNKLNADLRQAHAESQRLLKEVQARDARRGELLQRITHAQESERQRIARELHDETGQSLTGLAMGLKGIRASVPADGNERALQQLEILQSMATDAIAQLRTLINDLRPPQLDDMGLVPALRWLTNTMQDRSGLSITLHVDDNLQLDNSELETTLFRITQEGLNNIIKHAQAKTVLMRLERCCEQGVTLTITDDGVGFEPNTVLKDNGVRTSWGLAGIQERAQLIGAEFAVESEQGKGTTLQLRIRLDKEVMP